MKYHQTRHTVDNGIGFENGNRIQNKKDKGKGREIQELDSQPSDEQKTLKSLNQLLNQLSIPISLSNLSFTTPSLLLAILESLLERRFLNLNDPIRTSRTTQSREKCLKILLTILDESLDYQIDQWSSSTINLSKLNQNHIHELIQLVNGLIKLSIKCNNPSIGLIEPSIQSDHQITFEALNSPELNPQKFKSNQPSLSGTTTLTSQLASSLSSNASSYSTFKPTRMNFKSNFISPIPSPPAQSSPNHHRASSSSTSTLRRSLTRQHILSEIETESSQAEEEYRRSRPPTLKNLLEPLQAQLKRPQTPRTAHRRMVTNLRNKLESYFDDPKLDQDETKKEDPQEETEMIRGAVGMLTLDGIDDDDPFVSMETRRAMGSQFINPPMTPSSMKTREGSVSDHDTDDELTNMDFNPVKAFAPSSTSSVTSNQALSSENTYSPKILFASNGAKLSLIESDINKFETSNQSIDVNNSNWITEPSLTDEKDDEEGFAVRIRVQRLDAWIENFNGKEKVKEKVGLGRKSKYDAGFDDDQEEEEEDWI